MANQYNTLPIYIDTVMGAGWRSLQTLNTGTTSSTSDSRGNTFPAQPGIKISKILWTQMTAQGHQTTIVDPNSNVVLFKSQADNSLEDQNYDFTGRMLDARDFKVTKIDSGILLIWYRL